MKYAILSDRGRIHQIFDEAPTREHTELTDALAAEAQAMLDDKQGAILFEGGITNRKIEHDAGNRFHWDDELGSFVRTPIPIVVPDEVAAWAIKAQLELDGDVDAVEGYLATMEGAQGIVARRAYDGNVFLRASPSIALIQALLSKTDAEVDTLFIAANKLVA